MKVFKVLFLLILLTLFYCFAFVDKPDVEQEPMFELIFSNKSGIHFNNKIIDDKDKNILIYSNFYGGAGVGIGDFNNDGLEDIYFAGNIVDDKLYLNKGNFEFEDISEKAGVINNGSWSTSVTVADINNDGFLDIYVTKELYDHQPELRKNMLYVNQGNATFKEMAESYGVANTERTRGATFFDYNKDGLLDLFVLNQPPNPGSYSEYFGTTLLQPEYTSVLYKNVGGNKFVDVTNEAGLLKAGFPNAVSASDLNNDGWTDLYVSNDFYAPDFMYMNNKDGTFTNIANSALNHMSYYSMGVDVSDINNDGLLDIFVLDMIAEDNFRLKSNMSGMNPAAFWKVVNDGGHYQYMFNNLQLNNGNNTYSEIAQLTNIAATDWSWANLIADFDNDGEKDIYITNGLLKDIRNTDASKAVGNFVTKSADDWIKNNPNSGDVLIWDILDLDKALSLLPSQPLSNFMFKNNGTFNFSNVTTNWGLDQKSFSNGAAYADFDNDGDLDLVTNNINNEAFIYRNNTKNNYLRINLKSKNNTSILGARVNIKTGNKKQVIETTNVRGIYSTSEQTVHFGLENYDKVDEVEIKWPNESITVLKEVKANKTLEVYIEDSNASGKQGNKENQNQIFSNITSDNLLTYKHIENKFDDYKHQILLPHKMSQFGPALATADVNNDNLEDVFVGASIGNTGQLFIQKTDGTFVQQENAPFKLDKYSEDIDAAFFDVDNDGDQDLYVVSGGNEYAKANINYTDRLYINDGTGVFSKSNKVKSTGFSGSIVLPSDFDNDGDIDVFIGGRMVPQEYPLPTNSKLLENINGKLVDVTQNKAKDLNSIGMVTDAAWSDYDNDNDLDLIVVREWMPITIFENEDGKLSKIRLKDLKQTSGWWFSIDQGDFDNDGDMDFVAGNLGLNYKYKTTKEHPFDVYYKDFDGNGSKDIVLGYYNYGKHYPLRGFSCSSQQIPNLKKDIKKYDIFASLEIEEIYGEQNLSNALHYEIDTFASTYIENLGNGKFKLSELPIESQFSSINDMIVRDFNSDGNLDIMMIGNLYVSEIETPRNDAGTGVVLLGNGENNFLTIHHSESGFFARGDAKKIKMLKSKKDELVLVANNNDSLQIFKVNK